MLAIWTNKIKHSTVGSSFSVTFSVAPNELEYLDKLYDCFSSMNWSSFPITADRKTENSSEIPNNCEPQYEIGMGTLKCDNCSEYGSFKCAKCDGEMYFKRLEPKDEPTISKMEQVDKDINVRSKDEPQTDCAWK